MIDLPSGPSPAETISPPVLTLYGAPKIGKTSIVTALDSYLLLELEPRGAAFVESCKLDVKNLLQLVGVEEAIRAKKRPYKFIILDTLDEMEVWCEKAATEAYMRTPQGKNFSGESVLELPQGGGYFWLRNQFYQWFHLIRKMADYTIFIGHIRDKYLSGGEGKEVAVKDLDLTGKVRNIVMSYSDATAHAYRDDKGKLWLSFETKDSVACGSRAKHLAGKKFEFKQPATRECWKNIYPDLL